MLKKVASKENFCAATSLQITKGLPAPYSELNFWALPCPAGRPLEHSAASKTLPSATAAVGTGLQSSMHFSSSCLLFPLGPQQDHKE